MDKSVIVHGYVCIDEIVRAPKIIKPGSIDTTNKVTTSIGGVIGNTGSALARLGRKVNLIGRLGNDARAALVKDHFYRLCATPSFIRDDNYPTSISIALIHENGERTFFHNPGANLGTTQKDLTEQDLARASHYHFGYLFLSKGVDIPALLGKARKAGLTTSFDTHGTPTIEDKSEFEACARESTIVFPSYKEIRGFTNLANPAEMCQYLCSLGPSIAGIKLGNEGAIIIDQGGEINYFPTYKTNVVSTLGAGDSFFAGLIDAFLKGSPTRQILRWANATGTACVQGITTEKISQSSVEGIALEAPFENTGELCNTYDLGRYQR